MDVGKRSLLDSFIRQNNGTQFVIPIYQRNYVWDKSNAERMLNDIESMIPFIDDESKYHFFGSIVYIDTIHKGSFSEWQIIDGQQRITTIFLLLQCLKVIFPEKLAEIKNHYLENDSEVVENDTSKLERYRLKPLVADDQVYQKIAMDKLEEITEEEKQSKIYRVYDYIKRTIKSWKEEKGYDFTTIKLATNKLLIAWIQLSKNENPQQVFESINSTGVGLTPADLIRNFILMNKPDDEQTEVYNNYWKLIEFNYVKTDNLKEFCRFYISIKQGKTISEREVYELFKSEYLKMAKENGEKSVLEELLQYSKCYYYINTKCDDKDIEYALDEFRDIKSNMPYIIIMHAMSMYFRDETITKDDLINTIKLLTNFIVRRNVGGLDTKSISGQFGTYLKKILNYIDITDKSFYECAIQTIVNDTKNTSDYMPNDRELEKEFLESNLYSRGLTSYVLHRIENLNNRLAIDYKKLSVEHVMPQTRTSYWEKRIDDNSEYEDVVNRIGNLTLVEHRDNSSMSNKNFEKKKAVIAQTDHIKLNKYILDKDEWTEKIINSRGKILYKKFLDIFEYPKMENIVDNHIHIYLLEEDLSQTKDLKNSTPYEMIIGEESISYSNWADIYVETLAYVYEQVGYRQFINAYKNVHEQYKYTKEYVSTNDDELRMPREVADGVYIEANNNTVDKLLFIQRMLMALNWDKNADVSFEKNDDK